VPPQRHRGLDAPSNDKSQISYDSSAEKILGIKVPPRKADHEKTLGDLAQQEALFALCPERNRRKPIDRWGYRGRLGRD